jgi:hypothetical protein
MARPIESTVPTMLKFKATVRAFNSRDIPAAGSSSPFSDCAIDRFRSCTAHSSSHARYLSKRAQPDSKLKCTGRRLSCVTLYVIKYILIYKSLLTRRRQRLGKEPVTRPALGGNWTEALISTKHMPCLLRQVVERRAVCALHLGARE